MQDILRLISLHLCGDDLVAFTEVSHAFYAAVGEPAAIPEWDMYRAVRELNTLALRRHKINMYSLSLDTQFNVIFWMHDVYQSFTRQSEHASIVAAYRLCENKEGFLWNATYTNELVAKEAERFLAGYPHINYTGIDNWIGCIWREFLYRDDPKLTQIIIEHGSETELAYWIHSRGSLRAIIKLNSSVPFTSLDLNNNPHEDAVRYMIAHMDPCDCIDEYASRQLIEQVLEIHECTPHLANHGLLCELRSVYDNVERVQFWISHGATNTIAATTIAHGSCARWLMQRPEVRAAADIIVAICIKDSRWNCDDLIPYLKWPDIIASIACAGDCECILQSVPCGCPKHSRD